VRPRSRIHVKFIGCDFQQGVGCHLPQGGPFLWLWLPQEPAWGRVRATLGSRGVWSPGAVEGATSHGPPGTAHTALQPSLGTAVSPAQTAHGRGFDGTPRMPKPRATAGALESTAAAQPLKFVRRGGLKPQTTFGADKDSLRSSSSSLFLCGQGMWCSATTAAGT